jgi:hypothetical protein
MRVVEDVVAVEVELADGGSRFFVTWGRIQDPVDPDPVCGMVLSFAEKCSLGGAAVSARLCGTLKEAAESPDAPYFFECFLAFCRPPIPFGDGYEDWRRERADAMENGREIAYCGSRQAAR